MLLNIADQLAHRNLSIHAAAEKAGMDEERFRAVAEGAEPNLGELRKIAAMFKVPVSALFQHGKPNSVQMLFRKSAHASGPAPSVALPVTETALSLRLQEIHQLVAQVPTNLVWLKAFQGLNPDPWNADNFATRFRELFQADNRHEPLLDLPDLLANQLRVFVVLVHGKETEGASAIIGRHGFIVLSRRKFTPRMLFTLAHEVGHLVGHHAARGGEEFAFFDREEDIGSFKRPQRIEERFADAFASALLMPKEAMLRLVTAIRKQYSLTGPLGDIEINLVARFFGVSFEVAGRRFEDLGMLPVGGARTLYNKLVEEHSNPERRAVEVGLPARQAINFGLSEELIQVGLKKIKAGELSIEKVAEILDVPLSFLIAKNAEGGGR